MPKVTQDTHPVEDGWIHSDITLTHDAALEADQAEFLVCFGHGGFRVEPKNYEIALCEQDGDTLRGCVRPKAILAPQV